MILTCKELEEYKDRCMLLGLKFKLDDFEYKVYDTKYGDRYIITKWLSNSEEAIIPEFIVGIAEKAFAEENAQNIKKIDLSYASSMLMIPSYAFSGLKNLETIVFNKDTTEICSLAFSGCTSLTEFIAPPNLRMLHNGCFQGCSNLSKVILNDGLCIIGVKAFMGTAIEELNIPNSVTGVHARSFCDCAKLKKVIFGSNNCCGTKNINGGAFQYCENLETVDISNLIHTVTLKTYVFYGCINLKQVKISENGLKCGAFCFGHCDSLSKMDISLIEAEAVTDTELFDRLRGKESL